MDVHFLMIIFRLYPDFEKSFEQNGVRKHLFLIEYFCWDSGLSLRGLD